MSAPSDHLVVLPIVLPIAASGLMLLLDERRSRLKAAISLATTTVLLATALILAWGTLEAPQVYRLGNWAAPYGIVLVADRFAAMMLVLTESSASRPCSSPSPAGTGRGRASTPCSCCC